MDRETYRQKLAGRLRGARAESGLSQVQVEQATGIDTSRLSRIEKGERAIEIEDLLLLAGLYDVPFERFLEVGAPLGDPPSATRASSNGQTQTQAA
jgi:transcriptional regulator with XRE-family HTH domain